MVECTGLENQQSRKVLVGSNPTASASQVPNARKRLDLLRGLSAPPIFLAIFGNDVSPLRPIWAEIPFARCEGVLRSARAIPDSWNVAPGQTRHASQLGRTEAQEGGDGNS